MSEKIFVGGGKKKGENWFKCTISPDKIEAHIQEFKGHRFVKLDINVLNEPDQYGKDVKITIDEYNPEEKKEQIPVGKDTMNDDDVPF